MVWTFRIEQSSIHGGDCRPQDYRKRKHRWVTSITTESFHGEILLCLFLAVWRAHIVQSSKPPRDASILNETKQAKTPDESDPAEMLNLKRDLDLQRLLKESHLLEKSKASESPGKQRQMALDMRLQALGAKESIFAQQRMPVAHRLGITKKADQKEARRRKDAKENGVILERVTKKSTSKRPRDRGVDVPGVGKFAGGTLKLSRRDVANIQGPPTAARKGKRR